MKKDIQLDAEQKIADAGYVWTMNTNLGDGKMLQVTGNFVKDSTAVQMSAEVDKIAKMFQIQRLKLLEIPTCEGALKQQAEAGDKFTDDLEKLLEDTKGKERVNQQTKSLMENLRENIRRTQVNIEEGKRHYDSLLATLKELETE